MRKREGIIRTGKRAIAVGLMVCLACASPLRAFSSQSVGADGVTGLPMRAQAAEKEDIYVSDVRLAVDKKADEAKKKLEFAGYEVIDQDLNEKAGSFWNKLGDQAVYMGIRRTTDEKDAIRDMKTMNMCGKYS